MKKLSASQFENEMKLSADAQCLDVREPAEYEQVHAEEFKLCPLSVLSENSVASLERSRPTYLLCRSGQRACQAAERLERFGFSDLRVIEGGIGAFEAAGHPLIKGVSKVWALERQVRFAAGSLVLSGIVLSLAVHPGWIGLSAFVAAGLVFSAVTDTCGMAMVLARMPWNQR